MAPRDKIIGKFTDPAGTEFKVFSVEDSTPSNRAKTVGLLVKPADMERFIQRLNSIEPEFATRQESQIREEGLAIQLGGAIHTYDYPAIANDPERAKQLWTQLWSKLQQRGISVSETTKDRIKDFAAQAYVKRTMSNTTA
jgi:hypothetical protein